MSPHKASFYNSIYSENFRQQKPTLEFDTKEINFIQLSLKLSIAELQKKEFKNCIVKNTQTYPVTLFPNALVNKLSDFDPYEDLEELRTKDQQIYFSLLKNEIPGNISAYTSTNALSTTMKTNGIPVPGMIYLNKSTLHKAMDNNDPVFYGAYLIHEILHLYQHAHPGDTMEQQYDTPYFINSVTNCLAHP